SCLHLRGQPPRQVDVPPCPKRLRTQIGTARPTKANVTTMSSRRQYNRAWLTLSTNVRKIPSCHLFLTLFSFSPWMVALRARFKHLTRARLYVWRTSCATFVCQRLLAPGGRSTCISSSIRRKKTRKSAATQILQQVKTCSWRCRQVRQE